MAKINNVATSLQNVADHKNLARFTGAALDSITLQMNGKLDFGDNVRAAGPYAVSLILGITTVVTGISHMIAGSVQQDGQAINGTGFGSSLVGTGLYFITYTTPFTAVPITVATGWDAPSAVANYITVASGSTLGFQVQRWNSSASLFNESFSFMVMGPSTSSTSTSIPIPVKVDHNLGRQPQGFMVLSQDAASTIYAPDQTLFPWNSTQIWLASDAPVNASIYVI